MLEKYCPTELVVERDPETGEAQLAIKIEIPDPNGAQAPEEHFYVAPLDEIEG